MRSSSHSSKHSSISGASTISQYPPQSGSEWHNSKSQGITANGSPRANGAFLRARYGQGRTGGRSHCLSPAMLRLGEPASRAMATLPGRYRRLA
eukprot:8539199-Pyramimonas_sp.AAC.1